jgi:5-methylcytosine-specific restriction endonuclease McrA
MSKAQRKILLFPSVFGAFGSFVLYRIFTLRVYNEEIIAWFVALVGYIVFFFLYTLSQKLLVSNSRAKMKLEQKSSETEKFIKFGQLAISPQKLQRMCRAVVDDKKFSSRTIEKLAGCSRLDCNLLREEFIKSGFLRWNNENSYKQGVTITDTGWIAVKKIAESPLDAMSADDREEVKKKRAEQEIEMQKLVKRLLKPNLDYESKLLSQKINISTRKPISAALRYEVLKRDGYMCQLCGRTPKQNGVVLHVDHKFPVALGGTDDIDNLWTLCSKCNLGKGTKQLETHTVHTG